MERLTGLRNGNTTRPGPLLDPCRFVREADQALAIGDRGQARDLIAQAYLAFDLCSAGCRYAKAWGRALPGKNS
jgi:hypothetical protein